MSDAIEIKVPDIGDFDAVDVVEILVKPGDRVAAEQSLITLESDKASMEVPTPEAGTIESLEVKVGDQIGEGAVIARLVRDQAEPEDQPEPEDDRAEVAEPSPAKGAESDAGDEPADARDGHRGEETSPGESKAATGPSRSASAEVGEYDTDLVVLGSGPGGYTAAFRAADLGLRVTLIERYPILGGVCLNVGCIPSKALLHAAKVVDDAAEMEGHGIAFGAPEIDVTRLRGWKNEVVGKLTAGLNQLASRRKIQIAHGVGRFTGPHEIEVEGTRHSRTIRFAQAVIAAGSQSVELPGVPYDDPRVLDSTSALEIADIPARLLVIGGGIIGLEMATVYAALGSRVTVVELMEALIPGCDRDLVRPLERRIGGRYENIWKSTRVTEVKARDDGLEAFFDRVHEKSAKNDQDPPASAVFDRVLVAVGRRPNGGLVDADAAGVTVDERGFVPVDDQQRTNVPHIFAIGDLVAGPMLAHKATHQGKVAAEVAAGEKSGFDARVIPSVAYTDPEVAWVGLTETEAKARGVAYGKGVFPWAASGRSLGLGRDEGMTKLLFDPETRRLLGAGVVGPSAGDLVAEAGLAIEMGCDADDIAMTVHPHPTLSETVAFAAEAYAGTITDLYLPKKG